MTDKLINNHGGLYGRLTKVLHLAPFSLGECEEYYYAAGIQLSRFDQLQAYMIFGCIPFYLSGLKKGMSLVQNVDALFFSRSGQLRNEYGELYAALFNKPEPYLSIVETLAAHPNGLCRQAIADKTGFSGSTRHRVWAHSSR